MTFVAVKKFNLTLADLLNLWIYTTDLDRSKERKDEIGKDQAEQKVDS